MSLYDNLVLLPEDTQGWNGNSNIFEKLILELKPKNIVEVGTWKGQSAITMGKILKSNSIDSKIFCVDTWLGALEFISTLKDTPERNLMLKNGYPQIYYQFLSNVVHNKLENYIIPIPNTSIIGCKYLNWINVKPELIYIDASHEEFDVYFDLVNYYDLLCSGGVIFGDDFNSWEGVRRAVVKFCSERSLRYDIYENNFWIIQK